MADVSEPSRVWSAIGRIAVLLTAVLLLFQVGDYVFGTTGPKLKIRAESDGFSVPPSFSEDVRTIHDSAAKWIVRLVAHDSVGRSNSFAIRDSVLNGLPFERLQALDGLEARWSFHVQNRGNREAKDVRFESTEKGIYALSGKAIPIKIGSFEDVIPIGNIRPGNEVTLVVWTQLPSYNAEKKVQFTYAEGVAKASFSEKVRGPLAWIKRHWFLLFMLFSLLPLIILGWASVIRTHAKPPEQEIAAVLTNSERGTTESQTASETNAPGKTVSQ